MTPPATDRPPALIALIAAQSLCAAFFLWDVAQDGLALGLHGFASSHFVIELLAALGLIAAVLFEIRYLLALMRRKAHLERQVSLASGAFHEIIQDHFGRWRLSPSEQDVALFTIKGLSIAEIAVLRGSAEGTIKSHLNGIYRKSGVSGRGALLSLLIEDLMETPLLQDDFGPQTATTVTQEVAMGHLEHQPQDHRP